MYEGWRIAYGEERSRKYLGTYTFITRTMSDTSTFNLQPSTLNLFHQPSTINLKVSKRLICLHSNTTLTSLRLWHAAERSFGRRYDCHRPPGILTAGGLSLRLWNNTMRRLSNGGWRRMNTASSCSEKRRWRRRRQRRSSLKRFHITVKKKREVQGRGILVVYMLSIYIIYNI